MSRFRRRLPLFNLAIESVRDGYREYRKQQHAERLNREQYARAEHAPLAPYIATTLELWKTVFASGATSPAGAQC